MRGDGFKKYETNFFPKNHPPYPGGWRGMVFRSNIRPTIKDESRLQEAMERSIRWLDRWILAHKKPHKQNLFAIVQGGVNDEMRKICCEEMIKRNTPGYAIGGLAGGEDKNDFWRTVNVCTQLLPEDKPRYVMGIGYPIDILIWSLLGADMFDWVYATRVARFGTVFTRNGELKMRSTNRRFDFSPIDDKCKWLTWTNYTRSYLWNQITRDSSWLQLLSLHNVYFLLDICREFRQSIIDDWADTYLKNFITEFYSKPSKSSEEPKEEDKIPQWVIDALKAGGINFE